MDKVDKVDEVDEVVVVEAGEDAAVELRRISGGQGDTTRKCSGWERARARALRCRVGLSFSLFYLQLLRRTDLSLEALLKRTHMRLNLDGSTPLEIGI